MRLLAGMDRGARSVRPVSRQSLCDVAAGARCLDTSHFDAAWKFPQLVNPCPSHHRAALQRWCRSEGTAQPALRKSVNTRKLNRAQRLLALDSALAQETPPLASYRATRKMGAVDVSSTLAIASTWPHRFHGTVSAAKSSSLLTIRDLAVCRWRKARRRRERAEYP